MTEEEKEEFKRLKDFKTYSVREYHKFFPESSVYETVRVDDLRRSAVKDIKYFRKKLAFYNKRCDEGDQLGNIPETEGKIGYIKWKFNLTDEDLKPEE